MRFKNKKESDKRVIEFHLKNIYSGQLRSTLANQSVTSLYMKKGKIFGKFCLQVQSLLCVLPSGETRTYKQTFENPRWKQWLPLVRFPTALLKQSRFVFLAQILQRSSYLIPCMVILYLPYTFSFAEPKSCQCVILKNTFWNYPHPKQQFCCVYTNALERHKSGIGCRHRTNRMLCLGSPVLTCKLPTHAPFQTVLLWRQLADWATLGGSLWEGSGEVRWINIL